MTFQTHKPNAGYVRQDTDRRLDNSNCLTEFIHTVFNHTVQDTLTIWDALSMLQVLWC